MAREEEKLKLGKGAAFVKSRFKRLRQENETWEADFRALPKPITQSETHYLGLVVTQPDGFLLAESHVEGRPSVNDLATLLAHAMRRPLTEGAHRPMRIHQLYGDPMLMAENFEEMEYEDSTTTKLSDIIPDGRRRFRLLYEYDFGDSWQHEVLFEKRVEAEAGQKYPLCVDGARVCPPEDVGGTWGYADFVEAIQHEGHERHDEMLEWAGGSFDPEAFDPAAATKGMKKRLPDWRRMM